MHITLETDYAVRIVDCLGRAQTRMGAQAIADDTGVTLRFALKILRKLVASGILVSFKGASGGYEMNRELEDISMYDILTTIEGPYYFSRCLAEEHDCYRNHQNECPYHKIFDLVSQEVRTMLKSITMDQTTRDDFQLSDLDLPLPVMPCAEAGS